MVRFPVPGPRDLFRLTEAGYAALEQAIALVPRLALVLDRVEALTDRADAVVAAVDETRRRADTVVSRTDQVVGRAEQLIRRAEASSEQVNELLARLDPSLQKLAPILQRIADTTDPREVQAVVQLIDVLPHLVRSLDTEILPILSTLGTVAPDVRDLLCTMRDFNEILGSVPGLGRIKKRAEERQEHADARPPVDRSQQDGTAEPEQP